MYVLIQLHREVTILGEGRIKGETWSLIPRNDSVSEDKFKQAIKLQRGLRNAGETEWGIGKQLESKEAVGDVSYFR